MSGDSYPEGVSGSPSGVFGASAHAWAADTVDQDRLPGGLTRRAVLAAGAGAAATVCIGLPAQAASTRYRVVRAEVACLWRSPSSPRAIDAAAVRPDPDPRAWLRRLDAQRGLTGRLGLVGRLDSQLLRGEPVAVLRTRSDGWSLVCAPWQPSSRDRRGYRGWVAPGQLSGQLWRGPVRADVPVLQPQRPRITFLAAARRHLGLPYLWGGMSPRGLDCSGIVMLSARAAGIVLPRDASDQHRAAAKVPLRSVRPGDLYFFAHPGKPAHHVAIVTAPGVMLHAPQTGTRVREERLTRTLARTLVGAGRFRGLG